MTYSHEGKYRYYTVLNLGVVRTIMEYHYALTIVAKKDRTKRNKLTTPSAD